MEFISMDLIGNFPESSRGNCYALTVICMLTGYTFCIPIPSKSADDVVRAYVDNLYTQNMEDQGKFFQIMELNLKINYLQKLLLN